MNDQSSFATSSAPGRTMARHINAFNWADHPLGDIAHWPQALHTTVSTMLASRFPMYLAWGSDGFSLYNDGYIPILGAKHPTALGASLDSVWGELAGDIRALIDMTYEDQSSYFEDLPIPLLKHGSLEQCYFTFSYSGIRGESGKIEGFYAVCIETTDAFHAKQKRISDNARLLELFQQAPGFMAVVRGPTHIFEIANDAYYALIGQRDVIGKSVAEAIPEAVEQGFGQLLNDVYQSGIPYVGRASRFDIVRQPNLPATDIYVDFVYQPIFDGGRVVGIIAQGHEVTETHRAREALILADSKKDDFIATLAHELRNPLAPIRTAARLLELPNLAPAVVEKTSAIISRQTEHMAKLLDDLLDVARITRNQITLDTKQVSVESVVAMALETAKPILDRKNHKLTVQHQGSMMIDADPVRITQVLTNLVCNAAKYTDDSGEISITTIRCQDECLISVQDNGVGISPLAQETIFDMFTQDKDVIDRAEKGLGIGLSLVKGLVALHGGRVQVYSGGRGMGSTFTVRLPCLARANLADETESVKAPVEAVTALKILIADDNVDLVDVMKCYLEIAGHEILVATNGLTAIELAKSHLPDIAILDIGMPGMSGYDVAKAIRKEEWGRRMALIAATGWGAIADQAETKDAGFDVHLVKPIAIADLEEVLRRVTS